MIDENLVKFLIKNDVVRFGEFTLKSGRKSPYFYNARSLDSGSAVNIIGKVYAQMIKEKNLDFDVLFGPAYAGIPLVAATALQLVTKYQINKRFAYDRKEVKDYGDKKDEVIVGKINDEDKVLIVDDMITTGATKLESIKKINIVAPNAKIVGLLIVFDREEVTDTGKSAVQQLEDNGIKVFSLLKARELFNYLHKREIDGKVYVDDNILKSFNEYYEKYGIKE